MAQEGCLSGNDQKCLTEKDLSPANENAVPAKQIGGNRVVTEETISELDRFLFRIKPQSQA